MTKTLTPDNSLTVLHKDSHLLVLFKPSGVPSVPLKAGEPGTAVAAALAEDPAIARLGDRPLEGGLLHRLDTGTSGLLAFARNPKAFDFYRAAWKERQVRKFYRAIVRPEADSALRNAKLPLRVEWPISRSSKSSRRMIVHLPGRRTPKSATRGNPQDAITQITEIRWIDDLHAEVAVEIMTGVMHQIRVHLAALGAPIIGDPVYGKAKAERLMLHAWKLGLPKINTPDDLIWLEAPLPAGWAPNT